MSRVADLETGGLQFEERCDLSPEFDFAQPETLKLGFELPRDVDFYVVLGRHRTRQDFMPAEQFMDRADMLLVEGIGEAVRFKNNVYEEISEGNETVLAVYIEDIRNGGFITPSQREFELAKAFAVFSHRVPVVNLDPPYDHNVSKLTEDVARNPSAFAQDEALVALNALGRLRDQWCLNNLKRLVDGQQSFEKGVRRKVVITRGMMHLRLLRALEYQCEYNQKKAKGSQVIASSVYVPHGQDSLQECLLAAID